MTEKHYYYYQKYTFGYILFGLAGLYMAALLLTMFCYRIILHFYVHSSIRSHTCMHKCAYCV